MELTPADKTTKKGPKGIVKDTGGIALFMVIASVSVLAILVTEFTYIAQIGQSLAFGGLDQAKAHYLAKSGLKISLLRLKAYQQVTAFLKTQKSIPVPKSLLQQIWSFPFVYPVPEIPGMTVADKDALNKFQKESSLEGSFTSLIESESSKYNLNMLLANYAPDPTPTPSVTPTGTPSGNPSPLPFDKEGSQNSLREFFSNMLNQKFESDPDFAANYRDFRIDDFMDVLISWVDRTHERRTPPHVDKVPSKRAPFYSLSELHMLPYLDDDLYKLFAPNLTVNPTPGININTMKEETLRALIPEMNRQEVQDFFKFRDSKEADNYFNTVDSFYTYLQKNVSAFGGGGTTTEALKERFRKKNINLVIDETQFKITVRAQVNNSIRTIEAWVTLMAPETTRVGGGSGPPLVDQNQNRPNGPPAPPNSGLKITYMRIL